METRQEIQKEGNMIRNILFAIKRNFILILVVVVIATSLGLGYSFIKKPKYTAGIRVNFSIDGQTTATISEMILYIDTIVDFCGQGVVVDRANAYYLEWVENYQQDYYAQNKTIEDFYDQFSTPKVNGEKNEIFKDYKRPNENDLGTLKDEKFIVANAITTRTAKSEQDVTNWVYAVQYTDANKQEAIEKTYILVLAYKHELYWDEELGKEDVDQYFTDLIVDIDSLGMDSVASNVSKTKITILSFLLGVVIALAIVYIKTLFYNKLKDKDELERITGTQIIGSINYVREKDKNGK